jgi:ABC-type metal ion transport system substrate-binding protein
VIRGIAILAAVAALFAACAKGGEKAAPPKTAITLAYATVPHAAIVQEDLHLTIFFHAISFIASG